MFVPPGGGEGHGLGAARVELALEHRIDREPRATHRASDELLGLDERTHAALIRRLGLTFGVSTVALRERAADRLGPGRGHRLDRALHRRDALAPGLDLLEVTERLGVGLFVEQRVAEGGLEQGVSPFLHGETR
jgi:hypothetical protein